jgi:hypothetical protein
MCSVFSTMRIDSPITVNSVSSVTQAAARKP